MDGFWIDAVGFALRWLHVIAAIAWIGESFYFVMLDRSLRPSATPARNETGESWSVHGGGFYHKRKFMPGPEVLPEILHWSKWKSYTTWLSGFALFSLLYLASPRIQLIDPQVAALTPMQAIGLTLAFLLLTWPIYDALCRLVGFRDAPLAGVIALFVLALSFAATHLFAGRAAFLLVGAALATIMSANVFFVIIPGQKRMVAAMARGVAVDPLDGLRGKQRSVHNTYFTLPVVFAMLGNHYAPAFAHAQSWLLLFGFMLAGALIRQFFVLWHGGVRVWWLLALGAVLLLAMFAWIAPRSEAASGPAVRTAEVMPIFAARCVACHSAQPALMPSAPKGAIFDTIAEVEARAALIHLQVVQLRVMPPGNITGLAEDERARLDAWARGLQARAERSP